MKMNLTLPENYAELPEEQRKVVRAEAIQARKAEIKVEAKAAAVARAERKAKAKANSLIAKEKRDDRLAQRLANVIQTNEARAAKARVRLEKHGYILEA